MSETLWERYVRLRDVEDRNHLVELYSCLAEYHARRMLKRICRESSQTTLDDMIADGTIGLIYAIEHFKPEKGYRFSTYAAARIQGSIVDGIRSRDHLSRNHRQMLIREGKAGPQHMSIERAVNSEGQQFHDPPAPPVITSLQHEDFWRRACAGMNRQERLLMLMYYRGEATMRQIGDSLGISESRISQMHSAVMKRLRKRADIHQLATDYT